MINRQNVPIVVGWVSVCRNGVAALSGAPWCCSTGAFSIIQPFDVAASGGIFMVQNGSALRSYMSVLLD